tara:strand:+ start:315 stop:608 length:294 start_codon:yes stop_codon:yes gene_type:complete
MLLPVLKFVFNKQREDFKNNSEDEKGKSSTVISVLGWLFLLINIVLVVVPAILIARQCNPELKIRYSILAFFFADIYIFQWAVRKFIIHEPNYCEML